MLTIKTEAIPTSAASQKELSNDLVKQENWEMQDEETLELDKEEKANLRRILGTYGCDSSPETVSLLCKGVIQVTQVKPYSLVYLSTIELQQSLLVFVTFQSLDGKSITNELLTTIDDFCSPFIRLSVAKSGKAGGQPTAKKLRVRRK